MAVIRLILLVGIVLVLTLLLVQNFSPALPLVFLGVRSQPLPLAMWILLSVIAGGMTSLLVSSLNELANNLGGASKQTPPQSTVSSSPRTSSSRQPAETTSRSTSSPESQEKSKYRSNAEDDWNLEASEDWEFEQQPKPNFRPQEEPRDKPVSSRTGNYDREQQPTRSNKSGSSYSISYREPKNSGVGKTESVYDADYRVLVPPYQPPSPEDSTPPQPSSSSPTSTDQASTSKANNDSEDDDWSFFEEDEDGDFEDESRDSRK
jgi:hypothetical protein